MSPFPQMYHPSQWLGDGVYQASDSGKFARLGEIGEEIAARQEKVLVFTQFREMTEPLSQFLAGVFGRPGLVFVTARCWISNWRPGKSRHW
ncbi:hypothetical protein CCP4SC76_8010001 [Gammaproteobacteria bacterium]